MNTVISVNEIEMVNSIFYKVNIFGLVKNARLLMKGGINYEKSFS